MKTLNTDARTAESRSTCRGTRLSLAVVLLGSLVVSTPAFGQLPFQAAMARESNTVVLSWEAVPNGKYDIRVSPSPLESWEGLLAEPLLSPLNFVKLRQTPDLSQRFYQVLQLDSLPPSPWRLFPSDHAIAVSRQGGVTVSVYDDGTVDTNSISLSLNNGPPLKLDDPHLGFVDGVLTFTLGNNEFLGDYGQTITARLAASDLSGNALNDFSWSFRLEPRPVLRTNVLVLSNDPAGLVLVATNGNEFAYTFTGDSSGLAPGSILVSGPPNLLYRRGVLSVTEDPLNHVVVVVTTNVALAECFDQGSVQFTQDLSQQPWQFASAGTAGAPPFEAATAGTCCAAELTGKTLLSAPNLNADILSGRTEFRPRIALRGVFGPGGAEGMDLEFGAKTVLNVLLRAAATAPGAYSNRLSLGTAQALLPVDFAGGLPSAVSARLELALIFESEWEGSGTITAGLSSTNLVAIDAKLRAGSWTMDGARTFRFSGPAAAWETNLNARVRVSLEAELKLDLDGTPGPEIKVVPLVEARGLGSAPPGHVGYDVLLYEGVTAALRLDLRDWDGNAPVVPATNLLSFFEPVLHATRAVQVGPTIQPIPNMAWIPAGRFVMGRDVASAPVICECPPAEVAFTRGFFIGRYEVTQQEYLALMATNTSLHAGGVWGTNLARPIERVSWEDAVGYCAALTARERQARRLPAGYTYRLPTEAEWEYACHAGTATAFHQGELLLPTMANFDCALEPGQACSTNPVWNFFSPDAASQPQPVAVGLFAPNKWGLHDMHGNVSEWCLDWLGEHLPGTNAVDLRGSTNGPLRACRGGSYATASALCRSFERTRNLTNTEGAEIGFRVVLAAAPLEPVPFTLTLRPGLQLIAFQLDIDDNRIATLFGDLPGTATVSKFDPATQGFVRTSYDPENAFWSDPNLTLRPGEGAFFDWEGGAPLVLTFTGIPRIAPVPPVLTFGSCQIVSRQTPDPGDYLTIMLRPPVEGVRVLKWLPETGIYVTNTFHNNLWQPAPPTTQVGEAVFICLP